MYRLLIVTRESRVEQMFASMQDWEAMGFKTPRLRKTVEEAIECMHKHHIDAIAIQVAPEYAALESWLDENAPDMPIFEIASDAQKQLAILREIEQLLNRLRTDATNDDDYGASYYFQQAREGWLKRLMSGMVPSRETILSRHRMYRCSEDATRPCLFARILIPEGDPFITSRWHYGSERLSVALRNFFGAEVYHLNLHLAVVSPQEVRVVICQRRAMPDEVICQDKLETYLEETIEQVQKYLGLTMSLTEVRMLHGLVDFADHDMMC